MEQVLGFIHLSSGAGKFLFFHHSPPVPIAIRQWASRNTNPGPGPGPGRGRGRLLKNGPGPGPGRGPRPRWRMLAANYLSSAPVHRPSRGFIHRISFYPGCVRSLPNGLSGARKLDNVDNMLDKNVFQIMMSPSM